MVVLAYLLAAAIGTVLLMIPAATTQEGSGDFRDALFTSVSAVCITGMSTVDVSTYWTPFGQSVILCLVQIGGLGIMTLAMLLVLVVRGRLGLRDTLAAQADAHTLTFGDVRRLLRRIVTLFVVVELVVAVLLTIRFRAAYDAGIGQALWHGVFHGVSSVNNAGFALYPDGMISFVGDIWIIGPLCLGVLLGGLGYPVLFELRQRGRRYRQWSMHLQLTIKGTVLLFVVGLVAFVGFEWSNPGTLGPLGVWDKTVGGLAGTVFPRTSGFNSVDYAQIRPETMTISYVLMFIGGGSAGTAGGIKLTTFLILAAVMWAEIRGERDVTVGHRRIPAETQRQALTVALLGVACVMLGTIVMVSVTSLPLELAMFEVISAFSTVGLSANVTPQLPAAGEAVLMVLMFIGRVGIITVASSLALSSRRRRYQLPEERPIVG
ncbi:ATPase [Luteipulveratus mongoliensis]|uniref:ATPase n=2 Tax=Luteipulveratus mongoliensis TaxID=571913 RepID=A0A0K1JHF5_9MICO|nr:ATPase [Luteipulveratus mongoliensis]